MDKLNRFFWFCSGAHLGTLEKYPTEQNKYTGIGATIFFTGLFAMLSGGYAIYFVFKGDDFALIFAIIFGFLWGAAIFNMDRYIVSSINKSAATSKQLLQTMPRILLAVMIGIVISRPIELKIFDKEIKQRLKVSYLNGQRSKIDTLNKAFENKYVVEFGRLNQQKATRDSLESGIKNDRQKLNFEIFGNKTAETSGVLGYGPYAKRKEEALKLRQTELDSLKINIVKAEHFIDQRRNFDGLFSERLFTNKELDSLASVAGFADRNKALGQLKFNTDGTKDSNTAWAITFIGLLFIFFECLPVFVKLMSARGAYDFAIADGDEVAIYQSKMDRKFHLQVGDNIQETRVDAETAKLKEIIKGKAHNDLQKQNWNENN
ncbi:DUF4407 domain-containing protein [Pedobacter changchengzhani]|uniref:DUF4407 domain-containing protein n=1 Tax=Pedobacter changchengzhani TaxID=2529274 RepID=A0A4V3A0G8_9SPHI|nr:DUF4407 domain-containing protein [Pedobacter changchengzhani]TDG37573.1 DUF4407 domain-containing protein [Pedobacter changchengzhani]